MNAVRRMAQVRGDIMEAQALTEYVVTRWYRPPEVLLEGKYGRRDVVDSWSAGQVMAFVLLAKAMCPGRDYLDQLRRIFEVLGAPSDDLLGRICDEQARSWVKSLTVPPSDKLAEHLPNASDKALEVLRHLLNLDCDVRLTPAEALKLPFFADLGEDLAELQAEAAGCTRVNFIEAAPTAEGRRVQVRELISALQQARAAERAE